MTKNDLITEVKTAADYNSKAEATAAVDAVLDCLGDAFIAGEKVALVGFGTFTVKERAARLGRNPQTGEALQIAASKNVGFKISKNLKALL